MNTLRQWWTSASEGLHVQFLSDLHLDRIHYEYRITRSAPTLILGGDIGRFHDGEPFFRFLTAQCQQFDRVLLVPGNHEFYGCTRQEALQTAESWSKDAAMESKLVLLNRTRHDFADSNVTILGCTLHSHIPEDARKLSNDFVRIKEWCVSDHNQQHDIDLAWLKASIERVSNETPKRRVVIVTHYAPSYEDTCRPSQYRNEVSHCYCSTSLEQIARGPGACTVTHWLFGHTHWNTWKQKMGIIILSNQLQTGFDSLTWWQKQTLYRPFDPNMTLCL